MVMCLGKTDPIPAPLPLSRPVPAFLLTDSPGQEGVVINDIRPGSAEEQAGLRNGDLLLAVDGNALQSAQHLRDLLCEIRPRTHLMLSVKRGDEQLALRVQVRITPPFVPL
jgi:S1-C subfamily serine protease